MHTARVFGLLAIVMASGWSGLAQTTVSLLEAGVPSDSAVVAQSAIPSRAGLLPSIAAPVLAPFGQTCSPDDLLRAPSLSLRQRTCFYRERLLSKTLPLRAAVFSGMAEIRHSDVRDASFNDFGRRFGIFYARRAAQTTGELLAGYLNHEDPRYRPSLEQGTWKRTRSALVSVLVSHNENGSARLALAPLAGSFGSGLVGVACYRNRNSFSDGVTRSGFVYGMYLGSAIAREFKPELSGLATHLLHRHN